MKQETKIWITIVLIIALVIFGAIKADAQKYNLSPTYYPVEEVSLKYSPVTSTGVKYGTARPTWWQKNRKGLAITGIQFAAVALDAAGDAVSDMGKESHNDSQMFLGHTLQAIAIGGMGVSVACLSWRGSWKDGVRFGIGYTAMRYALFDLSYNLTRGIDPLYADGVKAKMEPTGRVITQGLALAFSVSWNFKEF